MYITILKKVFTYSLKFLFVPVTPFFFTFYYDVFNLDLFGQKRIERLSKEVVILSEINKKQLLELEERKKEINLNTVQHLDTQKILLYTTGIVVSTIIVYFIYSYFNNNNDGLGLVVDQVASNSKTIVSSLKENSKTTLNVIEDSNNLLINTTKNLNDEVIKTIVEVVHESNKMSQEYHSELIRESVQILSDNISNNNTCINSQFTNLINYIYENVAQKLIRIDIKLKTIDNFLQKYINVSAEINSNSIMNELNDILTEPVTSEWGEGRVLGTLDENSSPTIPVENINNTGTFNIEPEDIIFN